MNEFEISILKAVGKHYPNLLVAIDQLRVKKREFTGAGSYTDFFPIEEPVISHVQILDLHGAINLPNGTMLSAHIEMNSGVPEFLEICCLTEGGWNGDYSGFSIEN
jgi:hypothetical protein